MGAAQVITSRMRYISSQRETPIRIIGLATSLANAKDLGEWIGATSHGLFNFPPGAPFPSVYPGGLYITHNISCRPQPSALHAPSQAHTLSCCCTLHTMMLFSIAACLPALLRIKQYLYVICSLYPSCLHKLHAKSGE